MISRGVWNQWLVLSVFCQETALTIPIQLWLLLLLHHFLFLLPLNIPASTLTPAHPHDAASVMLLLLGPLLLLILVIFLLLILLLLLLTLPLPLLLLLLKLLLLLLAPSLCTPRKRFVILTLLALITSWCVAKVPSSCPVLQRCLSHHCIQWMLDSTEQTVEKGSYVNSKCFLSR